MKTFPKVIFENDNFLAFFKPAGLLMEPTKKSTEETFLDFLKKNYSKNKIFDEERYGLIHRLDKYTSGIILVAKNKNIYLKLKELFKQRKIKKTYFALSYNWPNKNKGLINLPIGWGGKLKTTSAKSRNQKLSLTKYFVLKKFNSEGEKYTFLKVEPKTGRTNQIRIHLAKIGLPIVGDNIYGRKKNIPNRLKGFKRYFLHAFSLEFSLEKSRYKIESPLPLELKKVLKKLQT